MSMYDDPLPTITQDQSSEVPEYRLDCIQLPSIGGGGGYSPPLGVGPSPCAGM